MNTILTSTNVANNSRPSTQDQDLETQTTGNFLYRGWLSAIPIGPEPPINRRLTKEFRLKQDFGTGRQRNTNRNFAIITMFERVPPPHVEKGTDGGVATRKERMITVILRTHDEDHLDCPLQLVIQLEVDQSWENVQDDI